MRVDCLYLAAILSAAPIPALAQRDTPSPSRASVDWPTYGGDAGGLKYSPLADVDRGNVAKLTVAFTWSPGESPIAAGPGQKAARPGMFQVTPLAIRDTLFLSTPYNRVVALDATNGRQLWAFDPKAWDTYGTPNVGTGFVHRGVATWTNGRERRVFINTRWRLIALDAATGTPIPGFGTKGEVDLTAQLSRSVRREHYANSSPPVVWGDLVIVGNAVGDRLVYRDDPPGDVQAFDVRTGKRVWEFKTVPQVGAFGSETWENGSWKYQGHTNVWAPFTRRQHARLALPARRHAEQRLVWRRAARRQFVRGVRRLPRCAHGQARLALPGHAPRALGLRPAGAA